MDRFSLVWLVLGVVVLFAVSCVGRSGARKAQDLTLKLPDGACDGKTRLTFDVPFTLDASRVPAELSAPEPAQLTLVARCLGPKGDGVVEAYIGGGGWVTADRRLTGLTLGLELFDDAGAALKPAPEVSSASLLQRLAYEPGDDIPFAVNVLRGPAMSAPPARAVLTILAWDESTFEPKDSRNLSLLGSSAAGEAVVTQALEPGRLKAKSNPTIAFAPRHLRARLDALDGTQRSDERTLGKRISSDRSRRSLEVEGFIHSREGTLAYVEAVATFHDADGEPLATTEPLAVLPLPLPAGKRALINIDHIVDKDVWERASTVTLRTRGDLAK